MTIRVGINGFGRIGRNFYRAARQRGADIDVVAANDLGDIPTMAHLLEFDSVQGRMPWDVVTDDSGITVDGDRVQILSERDPGSLPWSDLGVDVVIESTGRFRTRETAGAHLTAGASRVLISAPSKDADATFVVGVNNHLYDPDVHQVISNASCTTNCLAPMAKVLDDAFGIEQALMTTVHAYTGDQAIVDAPHRDLRRARAAAINVVPTTTGAARATGLVLDQLDGKLDGIAMRVPIPVGSIVDLVLNVGREASVEEVNEAFRAAASSGPMASPVITYSTDELVSSDIVGSDASCTFDSGLTMAIGNLVKVAGWYDNEWGYSSRLVDLAVQVGESA